jgi:hypothetical protein
VEVAPGIRAEVLEVKVAVGEMFTRPALRTSPDTSFLSVVCSQGKDVETSICSVYRKICTSN